jgi:hypothetical protein
MAISGFYVSRDLSYSCVFAASQGFHSTGGFDTDGFGTDGFGTDGCCTFNDIENWLTSCVEPKKFGRIKQFLAIHIRLHLLFFAPRRGRISNRNSFLVAKATDVSKCRPVRLSRLCVALRIAKLVSALPFFPVARVRVRTH